MEFLELRVVRPRPLFLDEEELEELEGGGKLSLSETPCGDGADEGLPFLLDCPEEAAKGSNCSNSSRGLVSGGTFDTGAIKTSDSDTDLTSAMGSSAYRKASRTLRAIARSSTGSGKPVLGPGSSADTSLATGE